MKAKRLVVLLAGLVGIVGVWVGLMAQSREITYIVFLREKVSPSALVAMKGNRVAVKRILMETAKRTQPPLLARLQQWQQEGKVQHFRSLWIVNAISVKATPEVIEALKRDPLVEKVVQARPVRLIQPIRRQGGIRPRQAFTWGLEKIRVPEVWSTFGIQGANVTVGVIDTGIAADHPDLVGKLRPVNGWFDPYGDTPSPSDWDGHGTHVSGTIAGGNASGTHIGVAPQATLIVAQLFNEGDWPEPTEAEVLACMQWMMDPDGDPNTNDGADVVNNSWGGPSHSPSMYEPIKDALNAWIAANIVPVFAIGNDGPSPRTTNSPGDYPMALGVGATDSNDNIADFSSRGPVFWEGIGEIIKPDVSAPGVYVYSSVPWGYEYLDGTSMASPHVAGTVALMISYARSQEISLSVDTIKQLLKVTAVDLGQSGPDNDYGWGRIDAFAALMPLAPDANEPNDNPLQATPIAFGETKFGKIEPDTDEDFFKFTGTQNTVITVRVDAQSLGSGIDAVLQILDSDGATVLAESDDSNGSKDPYIAKFVLPHAGDFYIRVTSKDFANELRHYALTLKLRSVPNLTATYNPQDNSVTLQWGSVFNSLRLASKRPIIRPLDLQGYRVYRATQAQGPYDLIANLSPDQTTYTDTNLPGQLVLYYRVTALYDEGESDPATVRVLTDPTEPNDDPSIATPIAYGQSLQGTILISGDVDFYKFDGQAGDLVTVEVRAQVDGSLLDSVLTLYDSDGQTVLAFNDDFADWWPVTYDSKLVRFPLPHDGTFYLKVEDYWGSGSENHFYTLTLVKDISDDHSDWPQNATQIVDGQSISGAINPPPDTDYFVFNANSGDLIIAEVIAQRQGSPLDSMLALYDEQGNLLEFNDDYYGLDSAIFYTAPQSGRYFLRVMPYGGPDVGGSDYTYSISLILQSPPRISVTPTSIEETLLQGSKKVVSVNVTNVGEGSLTFFVRSATSAISVLRAQPKWRHTIVVPESSKLYQDYLRMRQQKRLEMQQVIQKLLAKRDPNSQRFAQSLQNSIVSPSINFIPLKGGKPISTLQNEQPPSGTWRWLIVDPDEYDDAINVTKVFYQSDGTHLYFRAELDGGDFDPQNAYFDVLLDTDRNAGTGDRWIVDGMGIDYILYGGLGWVGVFKFNPATGGFDQVADFVWFKAINGAVEVGVKLSDIGNPLDLYVGCEFYDDNTGRDDRIPDIWYAPITRDVPWLDRSPVAGSLLANESVNMEVTLDSASLGLGIHKANLVFNSNDLEKQQLTVPVTLTVMQVPNIPELISPADGAIVRPQVTFVMKATDPDGDRVKFVIEARKGNDEVKTYETDFVESGQEASLTVPEGLSSGEWKWKAKAIDERGQESPFSSEQTFIVNQLPSKPELIAPANNAIVLPTPTFKVKGTDDDGDTLKFKLVIKQGEQIVAVFDQTQQTVGWDKGSYQSGEEATFTVPTNQRLTAGTYSWVAFAFDGKEWSEASESRVITVNQVVSVPELISPVSGAIVRPVVTFKMKATDPDGDRVKFVIEARKGNDEVKTYETDFVESGQEASLTVPEGLSSGEWKWKAKAIDERGQESPFSSEQTFIVNQLPAEPELIAPSDNAIVSPTPTFKLKSSDADGDQVKFEIEVTKGSRVEVIVTNFVNSGVEVSLTVPEDQALSPGQWTWKARAIDSRGEAGEWSEARTIQVISVPLIKSGVRLVACPVIGPTDPKSVFDFDGNKWAWFDPATGYLQYPNNQANLQVGKGYWAKFVQDTKPNVEGNLPDATQPFSISLKKGWNLIGNPWLVDLVWDLSSIKVAVGGQEKALKDLSENEGIEPYAWRWDGSNYRLVYDANVAVIGLDGSLPSWEGAWVYAHSDCELILPPPSQSKGRGTRDRGQVVKGNGWSIRLQAFVNGSVGEAVIGIANGTRGLAVGLPPDPPTGNNGVQVILLKNNVPLAVDVRSDGSVRQEWDVLVRFGARDGGRGTSERKEVTLTFDGIGYAPKDVSAWLVDTVTGKRLYLRTQTSYRFVAQEGEFERKFKVIVERGNDRPLRVVGLKATPMRGQGVVIEFSLTKPAKVEAEVLTLTGRRVAILDAGSSEGLTHRLVWRGVGIEGQRVGGGVYLIRVRAIDDEGRSTQGMTTVRTR